MYMCYSSRLFWPVITFNAGHYLERKFSKLVEIMQSKSHYAVQGHSGDQTDFSTNRKLIYDFLLVINTNLPPILHRFQVTVKFSLARGECLTLTLSLWMIPAVSDISVKTGFFGLHSCCRQYWCIFNHFYVIRPESYRIR